MAKILEFGEVIHVDFGAVFGGYRTDIARNATVGSPSDAQRERYAPLWEAQERILERMRPGVTAGELFEVGQRALKKAGLDYPWGTLGHSIGLSIHEGFEIASGSHEVLEENMVLNIEPTCIDPKTARYHLEDTVRVGADRTYRLSSFNSSDQLAEIL